MSSTMSRRFAAAIALRLLCELTAVSAVWDVNHWVPDADNLEPESPLSNNLDLLNKYWNSDLLNKLAVPATNELDPVSNELDSWDPSPSYLDTWPSSAPNFGPWRYHPPNIFKSWFERNNWESLGYNPSNYLLRDSPGSETWNLWNSPGSKYLISRDSRDSYLNSRDPSENLNLWNSCGKSHTLDPWASTDSEDSDWEWNVDLSTFLDPLRMGGKRTECRSYFTYPRPHYWIPQTKEEMKRHRFEHYKMGPLLTQEYKMRPSQNQDTQELPVKCWYSSSARNKHCSV